MSEILQEQSSKDLGSVSLGKIAKAQERRKRPLALVQAQKPDRKRKRSRLLSKVEVLEIVGHTFPTVWAWMRDGRFPRSREVGGKAYWFEHEIDAWLEALPRTKLKGD